MREISTVDMRAIERLAWDRPQCLSHATGHPWAASATL